MGVWGKTWNRAVFFGAGGVLFSPPVRFRIGPPSCLRQRSRSRAVVFPTSLSVLLGDQSGNAVGGNPEPCLTTL
jgi:hypothetical protein